MNQTALVASLVVVIVSPGAHSAQRQSMRLRAGSSGVSNTNSAVPVHPNPNGWGYYYDENSQKGYYFNCQTGESKWAEADESHMPASTHHGGRPREFSPPKRNYAHAFARQREARRMFRDPNMRKAFLTKAMKEQAQHYKHTMAKQRKEISKRTYEELLDGRIDGTSLPRRSSQNGREQTTAPLAQGDSEGSTSLDTNSNIDESESLQNSDSSVDSTAGEYSRSGRPNDKSYYRNQEEHGERRGHHARNRGRPAQSRSWSRGKRTPSGTVRSPVYEKNARRREEDRLPDDIEKEFKGFQNPSFGGTSGEACRAL